METKYFTFSTTRDQDSVVQIGSLESGDLESKYFGHYTEALEYLRKCCVEFTRENGEDK